MRSDVGLAYTRRFQGKLDGRTIGNFTKQLDYKNTILIKRFNLLHNLLKEDNYFLEYFNPDRKPRPYFNIFPVNDPLGNNPYSVLSHDDNICRGIEQMANYLLYCPGYNNEDILTKKQNIKISKKERPHDSNICVDSFRPDGEFQKTYDYQYAESQTSGLDGEAPTFNGNYKKEVKQKILPSDFLDPELECLHDYQNVINYLKTKVDSGKLNWSKKSKYLKIMGMMKDDQIWCKDKIKGTIYFKHLLQDSGMSNQSYLDLDLFEVEDCKILLKILPFENLSNNVNKYIDKFNEIEVLLQLTDKEKEMLDVLKKGKPDRDSLLQEKNNSSTLYTTKELSGLLNLTIRESNRVFNQLAKKVSDTYIKWYEDNVYYMDRVKGKYKLCSSCKLTKLVHRFGEDNRNFDGYKSICRHCDTISKKIPSDYTKKCSEKLI